MECFDYFVWMATERLTYKLTEINSIRDVNIYQDNFRRCTISSQDLGITLTSIIVPTILNPFRKPLRVANQE